jgi:hypothetical protein
LRPSRRRFPRQSIGETADFVIGAAAAGYDPATSRGLRHNPSALDYIATASDAAAGDAAKTGKAIAGGRGRRRRSRRVRGRDLLARLAALYDSAVTALTATAPPSASRSRILALRRPDGTCRRPR